MFQPLIFRGVKCNCNYLSTGCPVLVGFANKQSYVPETVWHHGSHVGFDTAQIRSDPVEEEGLARFPYAS